MFLADLNFFMSHLKTHPTVHLSTSKAMRSFQSKRKAYQKFTSFYHYPYLSTCVKKDTMVADKNSNLVTLVTNIIMLL